MKTFLHKYSAYVTGVLKGFDRLVLRGTLRKIVYPVGMMAFLHDQGVLLKDFGKYVQKFPVERGFYHHSIQEFPAGHLSSVRQNQP